MNVIKKVSCALILVLVPTSIRPMHPHMRSHSLKAQVDKAIQSLRQEIDKGDAIVKVFANNIGTTLFKPLYSQSINKSELDLDSPFCLGFYFEKRSRFDHGEFALVAQLNNHITLGVILGHISEQGNLETSPLPAKVNKTDPERRYIAIIDQSGTWNEYPANQLGKIVSDSQCWLTQKLLSSKQ